MSWVYPKLFKNFVVQTMERMTLKCTKTTIFGGAKIGEKLQNCPLYLWTPNYKNYFVSLSECTFQELSEKVSGMTLLTFPGRLSAPLCSVLEIHQSFALHFEQTNTGDNV